MDLDVDEGTRLERYLLACCFDIETHTGFFVLSTCLLDLDVDEVDLILGYLGGFVIFIPEQQIRVTLGKFRRPAAI